MSKRLAGRTDITQYYQSASELLNMIVEFYGGAKKAPGTYFVAEVKNSLLSTRIIPFIFSDTQAYIIELGNLYMRFSKDNAVTGFGGSILETGIVITAIDQAAECTVTTANSYTDGDEVYLSGIVGMTELNGRRFIVSDRAAGSFKIKDKAGNHIDSTGYTLYVSDGISEKVYTLTTGVDYLTAELFELQYAQTADIVYFTHPNHPQAKLTRTGHTAWTHTDIDYSVGEARPALMPSNITATTITLTGGNTLTASVAIFNVLHIGSIWKVNTGYFKVTGFTSDVIVTGSVLYGGTIGAAAYTNWSEGAWSAYRGYPRCVTISEGRLLYGYTRSQPQTVWGSAIGAYDTFELGAAAADAIEFTTDTNQVEVINWLYPSTEILVGTPNGLSSLGTGSDTLALSATTGRMKKKVRYKASNILPQAIGNNVFYWQKYNRTLREYVYSLSEDNYLAKDATRLSEHISKSGIVDMAYQQSPLDILWCVRADGKLAAFSRQIENEVSAWTLHDTQGFYESVAVIPKTSHDEVWFVVRRTIGGVTKRYIEYMVAPEFVEQEDAFFVHSGLILDNPKTITAITAATPPIVSCINDFTDGDMVKIRGVVGMTEVNYKKFIVANRAAGSFHLHDLDGNDVVGAAYTAYISGGEVRKCVDSVSGLDHLEGKTVQVLVDGASHPDRVVTSGAITLDDYYSQVIAGLGYTGRLVSNDLEGAPGRISSQGKIKRVAEAIVNIYKSLGCTVGDGVNQDSVIFRTSVMPTDQAPALFSGLKRVAFPSGWAREKKVCVEQVQPLPLHVRSIILEMELN